MQLFVPKMIPYIKHRPTPHQAAFLHVPQREAFYGGAAGGGKSDALLMAALQYVDLPGYHAVIVRDSFPAMSESGGLLHRAREWLLGSDASWNAADHRWRFPSGATLSFRPLDQAGDERAFMGTEYQFIGIDELTTMTEEQYRFLLTRLRRPTDSAIPLRMRATGMPLGPGVAWVRRYFVDAPRSSARIFIPARLADNPYLNSDYHEILSGLDPISRARMLHGDWSVQPEGGMFQRAWFAKSLREELPNSGVPLCRYWDLASSEPSAGRDPDYTCGVLVCLDSEGQVGVLDVVRERASALGIERFVRETTERDAALAARQRAPLYVRMEEEPGASGAFLIDHYLRTVLPEFDFGGIRPTGSKITRAKPVAARAEAGHVYLLRAAWNGAFVDELCAFPVAGHDDQVDALAGAYHCLVEESNRYEQQLIEYDPRRYTWVNHTTGVEVFDPEFMEPAVPISRY